MHATIQNLWKDDISYERTELTLRWSNEKTLQKHLVEKLRTDWYIINRSFFSIVDTTIYKHNIFLYKQLLNSYNC